jgi:hypothetical protein
MIVVPVSASPARRWLAHLVRAAAGSIRAGDPFDDEFAFEEAAVLALARRHRVAPLLHLGFVKGAIGDPLPGSFRRHCRNAYYATLRKNTVALEIGGCVRTELASEGIQAAPLKGWTLVDGSSPVYDDPGARAMDDLDLLVRPRDLDRTSRVLTALGFSPVTGRTAARLAGGHEVAFHRRVSGVHLFIELHWAWAGPQRLLREFAVGGDRFLDSFFEAVPGEERFSTPTHLGHLLFVALHAARHAFGRWIWLLDIHRLSTSAPLDWRALVRSAHALRVSRPVYAGLASARELLRTPVPKEVLSELSPGPVRRQLLHRSLAASHGEASTPTSGRVAKLLLGESWRNVARNAAWTAAPGRPWYGDRGLDPFLARRIRRSGRTAWTRMVSTSEAEE